MSFAASRQKLMTSSPTMQVTGGDSVEALWSARRRLRWGRQVALVKRQRDGTSCVASASDGGRPSGMVAKRNPSMPPSAAAPRERRRRRWLNSELTNVMWKPLQWRILASFSMGVTCPCAGSGTHTACGLTSASACREPISFTWLVVATTCEVVMGVLNTSEEGIELVFYTVIMAPV
jgi:hypothetical protein